MATPRQEGLVDQVVAVEAAADGLPYDASQRDTIVAAAKDLERRLLNYNPAVTLLTLGIVDERDEIRDLTSQLAAKIAELNGGLNPLDVEDPLGPAETPAQQQLLEGGLGDQAALFGQDVGTVLDGYAAAAGAGLEWVKWAAVAIVVVVLLGLFWRVKG